MKSPGDFTKEELLSKRIGQIKVTSFVSDNGEIEIVMDPGFSTSNQEEKSFFDRILGREF